MKILKEIKHRTMAVLATAILLITTIQASNARLQIQTETDIKVTTICGQLEGQTLKSGIHVFMGIPYAAAPIGELRWKAPQPFPKWNGIRKATNFGSRPIQKSGILYEFRSEGMSEDCLYLNIWTPSKSFHEQMPVYVFIHGGSFIHGDGSQVAYDGESMAKQGIVYVSINYRLGVFGFLAHPELSQENAQGSSGNYGLLDQLAALKWVQENISAFGGDPKQVTLGENLLARNR
ncbi:carboxylesterase family protein [Pedobacter sp. P26]|uniref:carboxylesterase family protein n=1 Tax=Pedobacter sp. P26 TaxID=3423956 RepID=UPI003D6740A3